MVRTGHGLPGPVRTCLEETIYPEATTSDGTQIPERKSLYTTEYDVGGRVIAIRIRNSDSSEWITRRTYDASGHLLKTTSGMGGEPSQQTGYFYDARGRLLGTTDVSKHLDAMIDGVIHDTHDCSREGTHCMYGYRRKSLHFPLQCPLNEKGLPGIGQEALYFSRDIGRGGGDRNCIPNF